MRPGRLRQQQAPPRRDPLLNPAPVALGQIPQRCRVEQIVILGNSGGGSLMGAYQAEAIAPTLTDRLPSVGQDALAQLIQLQITEYQQLAQEFGLLR